MQFERLHYYTKGETVIEAESWKFLEVLRRRKEKSGSSSLNDFVLVIARRESTADPKLNGKVISYRLYVLPPAFTSPTAHRIESLLSIALKWIV